MFRYVFFVLTVAIVTSVPMISKSVASADPTCSSDGIKALVAATSSQLNALQLTGNSDKDFAASTTTMMRGIKALSQWETKCGSSDKMDAVAKKMTETVNYYIPLINSGG
jgi:hypothetical protein